MYPLLTPYLPNNIGDIQTPDQGNGFLNIHMSNVLIFIFSYCSTKIIEILFSIFGYSLNFLTSIGISYFCAEFLEPELVKSL